MAACDDAGPTGALREQIDPSREADMAKIIQDVSRRGVLKTGLKGGAAITAGLAAPMIFTKHSPTPTSRLALR